VASRATIHVTPRDRDLSSPTASVSIEHALQNWLAELRLSNRSQTTIDWYRDLFLGRILPGLKRQGVQTVDQIRREHVRYLREQLQREGRRPRYRFGKPVSDEHVPLTPASLHAYHRVLRAFYRWCVSEGFSPDHGVSNLKTPREPSREPRIFTPEEVEAMLHAAEPRDRLILELLLETGLRASELCALDVSDFRVDHPDGPYLDVRSGKGAKQRAIPLTAGLTRKLRQYLVLKGGKSRAGHAAHS
jgi:site-specific recombinase XerD